MPINFETGRSTRTWESPQYTSAMCAFHHPPIIFPDQNTSTRHPNKAPEMVVSYVFFLILWGGPFFYVYIYLYMYIYIYIYISYIPRKMTSQVVCWDVMHPGLRPFVECLLCGARFASAKGGSRTREDEGQGKSSHIEAKLLFSAEKTTGGVVFLVVFVG